MTYEEQLAAAGGSYSRAADKAIISTPTFRARLLAERNEKIITGLRERVRGLERELAYAKDNRFPLQAKSVRSMATATGGVIITVELQRSAGEQAQEVCVLLPTPT